MIRLANEEWITEAQRRYGPQARNWRFRCPSCGHVQSVGWCFGPTFLAIQRDKLFRAEWDAIQLTRRLGDLQEQYDQERARSEAILGQAKRWAREAKERRACR